MSVQTSALGREVKLRQGAMLPTVGLGVFQSPRGEVTREAVKTAITMGYRHIDTARIYGNEADVGAGIRDSGVPRSEVFVTTKLWNADQGYDAALRALDASLQRLRMDYVDLYLVHWPVQGKRLDSWRALEKLHADGRAKAIGVSNFMTHHLKELAGACTVVPHVNQIEVSPFLQQRDVRATCAEMGIVVEAYSPLTRGLRLAHPIVLAIADEVKRTPAQVLLRWGLEHGMVVLPKSTTPSRIAENFTLFDFQLTDGQRGRLDGLEEGLVTGWDPRNQA